MFTRARSISALLAGAALAFAPPAADAQTPIRVGVGGGISMPVGDIAKTSSSGINLVASLTYDPRRLPVGFEANAAYHNFAPAGKGDDNSFVMAVTGGITIPIASTFAKPYLMAGAGYYNTQGPTTGAVDAERDLGGYGGVGIRFRNARSEFHVKATFHEIFADRDPSGRVRSRELIPISFGVVF